MLLPLNFTPSYDILFKIALHLPHKRITSMHRMIAMISSCKQLWNMRKYYYETKQMLECNSRLLNFWTPEMMYYAMNRQFVILSREQTLCMNLSFIYEKTNLIACMDGDEVICDDYNTIEISNRFILITYMYDTPICKSFSTENEIVENFNDEFHQYINGKYEYQGQASIIDLSKSSLCWSHGGQKPKTEYTMHDVRLVGDKLVVSGYI